MGVLPFDPRAELLKSIALYNTKRNRFEKHIQTFSIERD